MGSPSLFLQWEGCSAVHRLKSHHQPGGTQLGVAGHNLEKFSKSQLFEQNYWLIVHTLSEFAVV